MIDYQFQTAELREKMTIEVLGDGCSKCKVLKKHVQQAISELELNTEVSSVVDPERIAYLEVLSLPQLVIDGQVVAEALTNTVESIKEILRTAIRG